MARLSPCPAVSWLATAANAVLKIILKRTTVTNVDLRCSMNECCTIVAAAPNSTQISLIQLTLSAGKWFSEELQKEQQLAREPGYRSRYDEGYDDARHVPKPHKSRDGAISSTAVRRNEDKAKERAGDKANEKAETERNWRRRRQRRSKASARIRWVQNLFPMRPLARLQNHNWRTLQILTICLEKVSLIFRADCLRSLAWDA